MSIKSKTSLFQQVGNSLYEYTRQFACNFSNPCIETSINKFIYFSQFGLVRTFLKSITNARQEFL